MWALLKWLYHVDWEHGILMQGVMNKDDNDKGFS